jgi:geranylgeranyl diphosphate synthase type II
LTTRAGLDAFLKESRERVDRYLDLCLPPEAELPEGLHGAMRYAVFSGGKRLRPALAFGAARACGAEPERALPVAGAVELVHAYSLVHDDLPAMDDDDERRGRPSVHVKFGEATAILVGDALLAEAFRTLAAEAAPVDVIERLARAAGSRALVGGQADDLALREGARGAGAPALDLVTSVHARKTGQLFRFATWGGARLASGPEPALASLDRFGAEYGAAFQLVDDLADRDTEEGSALAVLSPEAARGRAREHLARATDALAEFGSGAEPLRALAESLRGRLV